MKALTHQELRAKWFTFWQNRKHLVLPSASLVAEDNGSLLWNNSGVAGLKQYFLGNKKPPASRLTNIQKSLRTSDLSLIGITNRHLSFFEMMGNFAIDDYDRRQAILWAWEFLTSVQELNIDPQKIIIVYFKEDQKTYQILKNDLKLTDQQIVSAGRETNFWDLGVGPCGPNLEFYYDYGSVFDEQKQGIKLLEKNIENKRYLEIWNIVFSEFINDGTGKYRQSPTSNIDTGAGLERILMVLQNKQNPFETDLFDSARKKLEKISGVNYISSLPNQWNSKISQNNYFFQVILDHIRATTFMLSDLLASNEKINFQKGRGYIIRKMIRTAIMKTKFLNSKPFMISTLISSFVDSFQPFYPNLGKYKNTIEQIVIKEENQFRLLLNHLKIKQLFDKPPQSLSAQTIFLLVTSLGFPLEFIVNIAHQKSIKLDLENFQKLWTKHQKLSADKKIKKTWIEKPKNFIKK